MAGFTFLLEAFILLMGLAMAEVLRGFARVLKLRARRKAGIENPNSIRIGWLVPLLGLFVLVDQSTFFLHMFLIRESAPFNALSVLWVLVTIGWYYLVASLVFPDKPADWPDFDDWYWLQRRWVLGGVLGVNVLSFLGQFAVGFYHGGLSADGGGTYPAWVQLFGFLVLPLMLVLVFIRSARWSALLLAAGSVIAIAHAVMTADNTPITLHPPR